MAVIPSPRITRTRNATRAWRLVVYALFATAAMCLGTPALAGAQAPAPGGGPREGITVHGHWEIEVRNPDGTVATRTEFENALVAGSAVLSQLMQGRLVPGRWTVAISGVCGTGSNVCFLIPPGSAATPSGDLSETLSVIDQGATMQLSGSFAAPFDGSIWSVATTLVGCRGSVPPAPDQCLPTLGMNSGLTGAFITTSTAGAVVMPFTATTLSPIVVTAGQIVQVRVTISFS